MKDFDGMMENQFLEYQPQGQPAQRGIVSSEISPISEVTTEDKVITEAEEGTRTRATTTTGCRAVNPPDLCLTTTISSGVCQELQNTNE